VPTLLAFIPHPDDESYAFGGLLALAARAGWTCHVQCASSGETGQRHDGGVAGREELGETREGELSASCRVLGAEPPTFWRLPDRGLRGTPSQAGRIADAIDSLGAGVVLTLGPDGAYGHPDHVALHRWVVEAHELTGGRPALLFPAFPRGLFLPQYEKCTGMMGDPPDPLPDTIGDDRFDLDLDIWAVQDQKLAAIAAHQTQLPGREPRAIFPAGIVDALLDVERYTLAGPTEPARRLFRSLTTEITESLR
jgi:LmbE family N-acetylglucosaminyl deacetylase